MPLNPVTSDGSKNYNLAPISGGITSLSGDGTFVTNASSTGVVTLTLGAMGLANSDNTSTKFGINAGNVQSSTNQFNSYFGNAAGLKATTGTNLTCVGASAGASVSSSSDVTLVGYKAGLLNTSANTTACGSGALDANTSGQFNSAFGKDALGGISTSSGATAMGYQAAFANTASNTTAFGSGALDANTSGTNNNAFGRDALGANQTGGENCAFGHASLANSSGNNCVAMGASAAYNHTSGARNVVIGALAGTSLTTGSSNVFVGYNSGSGSIIRSSCTYVGNNAGALVNANFNTAVGADSLSVGALTSIYNCAFGYSAMAALAGSSASGNSAYGVGSGGSLTTGEYNCFFGYQAGWNQVSGSSNILIGNNVVSPNTASSSFTNIGDQIIRGTDDITQLSDGLIGFGYASMPERSASWKKVVVVFEAWDGVSATVDYNFPVAFSKTPSVFYGDGIKASIGGGGVTVSKTKVTIPGIVTSQVDGTLTIEGM